MSERQISLIPVQLVDEQPHEGGLDKDLIWTGSDDQDRRYALKTVEPGNPLLPLTEWLCYHLCNWMGILAPDFHVVVRIDGSLAFGSRWEINARQFSPGRISDAQFTTWIHQTRQDISGMFALDAFMPNEDRHFRNMLFVDTGARLRALAFDWSRTRIFTPWPWPEQCKSWSAWNFLVSNKLHDLDALQAKLRRACAITGDQIADTLHRAPVEWRIDFDIDAAAIWWDANKAERSDHVLARMTP